MIGRKHTRLRTLSVLLCVALLPGCASVLSATRDDDRSTLARLLRNGASPNEGSTDGTTPLFVAIEAANLPAARLLVEAGADVNGLGRCRGREIRPLQKAAIHGDLPLVRYLLSKGADPTLTDADDVFTLMALSKDPRNTGAITAAIVNSVRARGGDAAAKALVDARSASGWTPLAAAAWFGDMALVDALLRQGASVDQLARRAMPILKAPTRRAGEPRGRNSCREEAEPAAVDPRDGVPGAWIARHCGSREALPWRERHAIQRDLKHS
jgi:ankyrin repeat protein